MFTLEDGVKFIFKTLIKVPVIIFVSYLIFNLFSYTVAYFRLYSAAQVVNDVVMENNYIPSNMVQELKTYMDDNVSSNLLVLSNTSIPGVTVETSKDGASYNNAIDTSGHGTGRVQYGGTAKVTVQGRLIWLNPLTNSKEEYLNNGVSGLDGTTTTTKNVTSELTARGFNGSSTGIIKRNGVTLENNIKFEFTVPCMKYYADIAE